MPSGSVEASPISLNIGENTIPIRVTAKDGSESIYTITVYRGSDNCDLDALALSEGDLEPIFAPNTTEYTATVRHGVDTIEITAVARTGSAIDIDTIRTTGAIAYTRNLEDGDNPVSIQVIAENGFHQKTYHLNILRRYSSRRHRETPQTESSWRENNGNLNFEGTPDIEGSSGKASVQLNSDELTDAFDNASQDDAGIKKVEVNVPKVLGANGYETTLPADSITGDEENRSIEINTRLASVTLPTNMIEAGDTEGAENVSLSVLMGDTEGIDSQTLEQIGDRPIIQLEMQVDGKPFSWSNNNAPVTVSIPYEPTVEELEDPEHITVWYIDGAGNVVEVPSGRYDPDTGMVIFTTTHFSHYAVAYVQKTFNDLDSVSWAKKQIEVLASKGIINGTTKATYSPQNNITRGDYLTLLIRTLGLTAKVDANFIDVNQEDYFYNTVGIAKKLGITSGDGNNHFNPKESITRQDMMVLTERALNIDGRLSEMSGISILEKFNDKTQISKYAEKSIGLLIQEKLIQGSGSMINPQGNTTRAEAAVLLYRIYNK